MDTLNHPVTLNSVLRVVGWEDQSELQSEIWLGGGLVTQEVLAHLSQGNALTVIARQPSDDSPHPSTVSADTIEPHVSLLQKQVVRKPVRLTLEELIPAEEDEIENQPAMSKTTAIRLISGADMAPLPTYVECPFSWCEDDIRAELHCWGHQCDVYRFGVHDAVLCFPCGWTAEAGIQHYMFCHTDATDRAGTFLHSQPKVMTELDLMSFLYECGYWRATIQSVEALAPGLFRVHFLNVQVQQALHVTGSRAQPAWPDSSCLVGDKAPYFVPPNDVVDDDCVIELGMTFQDFMKLF